MLSSLLLSLPRAPRCPEPLMDANAWLEKDAPRKLGFLPFPLEEALLPGETKQVHLYEARFVQLFDDCKSNGNCLGALYFTPQNNIVAVTSLLEVEEFKAGADGVGVWANLKCVGRVQLQDVEKTEFDYIEAVVDLYKDADAPDEQMEKAVAEIRTVHTSVVEMEERLRSSGGSREAPPDPLQRAEAEATANAQGFSLKDVEEAARAKVEADEQVEWGHELRNPQGEELTLGIDQLIDRRRGVLCSRGPDTGPRDALIDGIQHVWDVRDDAHADLQLFSFAASATLSPSTRAQAIGMSSTAERLNAALAALQEQQRRLSALLMLRSAGLESGGGGDQM